jgi:uncharacterized membrane protein YbhN (UPF0104 family)
LSLRAIASRRRNNDTESTKIKEPKPKTPKSTVSTREKASRTSALKSLITPLKLCATAVLLFVLIHTVGWQTLWETISNTQLSWLLALYGMSLLGLLVHAHRLLKVLRLIGLKIGFWRVFLANALSAFYSLVLPGDLLAGAAKWADLSAATGRSANVFSAIIYNRVVVVLTTLLFGAMAVAIQDPLPETPIIAIALALALGLIGLAFLAFHRGSALLFSHITQAASRFLPAFVAKPVHALAASVERLRNFTATDHLYVLMLGLLSFLMSLAGFAFAALAGGVALPFLTLVWVNALLLTVRLLPITIGNLGIREGLLIVIMGTYGIEPAQAVAVGLIVFTSSILNAVVGLCYQLALMAGLARWRPSASNRAPAGFDPVFLEHPQNHGIPR